MRKTEKNTHSHEMALCILMCGVMVWSPGVASNMEWQRVRFYIMMKKVKGQFIALAYQSIKMKLYVNQILEWSGV